MSGIKNFYIVAGWRKKNKGLIKILAGIIVFLFLFFVLNIFVLPVKNYFYALSSPIQKVFWTAGDGSSTFLASLLNAGSLNSENEKLKKENQNLLSQIALLQLIKQGNQAQSDVSAASQNTGFKLLMTGVIGLDNDILSINKGSADGIAEGMPVIGQQNVLFGKVFKVYKNFSQIMLISNKNSVTNVEILGSEIDGVIKGSGGLASYLDLIPISSDINPQDVLVTSSIDKSFPKGLLVGEIVQKQKNDQEPFQKASVNLFFNIKTADNLFVITNYKRTD